MMKSLFITLGVMHALFANGQNFVDLANVYWRTSPGNKTSVEGEKVTFNMYVIDARVPVVLGDKTTLLFGTEVTNNSIDNLATDERWVFSSVLLQLGLEQKWNDGFKSLFVLMPKLSTNFTGVYQPRDLQFGGTILNTLKRSPVFDWRFGAYVNDELFSIMVVPLLGFNWKINEKWRLKTLVPVNLEASRIMNKKWIAGFLFTGANASYHLKQQLNPNTAFPGSYEPYLDKADNNAWLYSDIYLTKNLVLNLKAGHSILRKYRIYDADDKLDLKVGPVNLGNDRLDVPELMKNGWSFEARLVFRMGLK